MTGKLIGTVVVCTVALALGRATVAQENPGKALEPLVRDISVLAGVLKGLDQREQAAVASLIAIERAAASFPVRPPTELEQARSHPLPSLPPELTPYLDRGRPYPCLEESVAYASAEARCLADVEGKPPEVKGKNAPPDRSNLTFRELVILLAATADSAKPKKPRRACAYETADETAALMACMTRFIGGLHGVIAHTNGRR